MIGPLFAASPLLLTLLAVQLVEVLPRYYGLLWEWSRSPSPELSIASAAVLRALYFESTPLGVHHWHQTALDWGVRPAARALVV